MTNKMKKRLRLRMKKIVHLLTPPLIEDWTLKWTEKEDRQLRQRRDQLEELQDIVGGSEDVRDHKVLSQLEEKLNAYIQELPVLGFNSGKYDLNASKEFLFPYLIKHQPIKFTVKRNNNHMCIKTDSLNFYHLIKDNNTGGPSIIFHRYHEAGKTKIGEAEEGEAAKPCEKIVGYDANALYLWALMQDMPTGSYTRRLAENEFKPKSSIKMAIEWLEWVAHQDRIHIRHQLNSTEKRIGDRKLPVDGLIIIIIIVIIIIIYQFI